MKVEVASLGVQSHDCGIREPRSEHFAFRYLPPNSASKDPVPVKIEALLISAQLSPDAVSALRKVLIRLCKQHSAQART